MDLKLIEKLSELARQYPNYKLRVMINYRGHLDPLAYVNAEGLKRVIKRGDMSWT